MERLPCDPDRECKYDECREDIHHLYWPRKRYSDKVSRAFRNLAVNKVVICREAHDDIHASQLPPKKPSRNEMLEALNVQS